jgi:beta-carotene ketolase (CrtW type)
MGIIYTIVILVFWGMHQVYILLYQRIDPADLGFWLHLLIQTWLFTGLFITAHDAMHGTVTKNNFINNALGSIASFLYAGLWYPKLKAKHYLHHMAPGTAKDPDYTIRNQNFFVWWFRFMRQYITIWQILVMAGLFNIGLIWFNELHLIVFWIIPSVLSTFQLFYFGTYVPHRLPHTDSMKPHNARSQRHNHFMALLTCYFFGYHYEHHASPRTPWWLLYRIKQ